MYDLFQNFRIKQASSEAADAKYAARDASISIKELQDKLDYMSVVVTAMCELLENVGFTEETLIKKIQEVDMRDGKMDGKYLQTKKCPKCDRIMAERHLTCIYCGTAYNGN